MVAQSSLAYATGKKPLSPYWIATAGAVAGCFRNVHNNYATGTLWVDPYWVSFYLTNFHDGYRRRALIGSLCRFLFPAGMNVVLINVVAVLALLLCMAWFIRSVGRLSLREPTLRSNLFLFALSASAVSAVFAEVLGDTLQIAFLVFLLTLLLARRLRTPSLQSLLALGALTLGFFIHEASIFFLAPALPFFLTARPKLRDFALPAAAFAALLTLSIHWSVRDAHLTYGAILYPHGFQLAQPYTPSFKALLLYEYHFDFDSRSAFLAFSGMMFRILLLGLMALAALAQCLPRETFRRIVRAFGVVLIVSAPLWLIAHDWGRFLAYAFFFAIASTAHWPEATASVELSKPLQRLESRLISISSSDLLQFGLIVALLDSPDQYSRVEGLSVQDAEIFCLIALVATLAWLSAKRIKPVSVG